jgi:hypothetical protein
VRVIFSPSGRATEVSILSGPLLGTAAGACVLRALASARVHAFEGAPVGITTTLHL